MARRPRRTAQLRAGKKLKKFYARFEGVLSPYVQRDFLACRFDAMHAFTFLETFVMSWKSLIGQVVSSVLDNGGKTVVAPAGSTHQTKNEIDAAVAREQARRAAAPTTK